MTTLYLCMSCIVPNYEWAGLHESVVCIKVSVYKQMEVFHSMKLFSKAKVGMILAEFLGTALLTMTILTVSKSDIPVPFFIAAAVGTLVTLMTVAFSTISGAHFNPAVTLGFLSIRKIRFEQAFVYIAVQLLGAIAALRLDAWLTDGKIDELAFGSINWKLFVAELIGATVFGLVLAAVVTQKFESVRLAAIVGTGLFMGILIASIVPRAVQERIEAKNKGVDVGSHYNGVINPAAALGTQNFGVEYLAAPVLGVVIGMNVYTYVFTDATLRRRSLRATPAVPVVATEPVVDAPALKKSVTAKKVVKKKKSTRKR